MSMADLGLLECLLATKDYYPEKLEPYKDIQVNILVLIATSSYKYSSECKIELFPHYDVVQQINYVSCKTQAPKYCPVIG